MKQLEYYYNVIYYFFYRATIKFALFVTIPIFFIYGYIYKIPIVKRRFKKKGIDDPLAWHKEKYKNEFLGNTSFGAGTMIGHGFATSVILFFYMGIYYIVKYLFFPTFEDSFVYVISVNAILAYSTDIIFTQTYNKSEKYIKEFNEKKGWWRIKWKIITILSLFISLWFSISTSSTGMIGRYLISLHS